MNLIKLPEPDIDKTYLFVKVSITYQRKKKSRN